MITWQILYVSDVDTLLVENISRNVYHIYVNTVVNISKNI